MGRDNNLIGAMSPSQKREYQQVMTESNPADLAPLLKNIMLKSVGIDNGMTKAELFSKCFGKAENYTDLQVYFLWKRIVGGLSYLRRRENTFVISKKDNVGTSKFFIPCKESELVDYTNRLEGVSKGCKNMIKRAQTFVETASYKDLRE